MNTKNGIVIGTTAFWIFNIHFAREGVTYYLDKKGTKNWNPESKFVKIAVPNGYHFEVDGEIIRTRFGRMATSCSLKEARN